jgi:hypothetical protein
MGTKLLVDGGLKANGTANFGIREFRMIGGGAHDRSTIKRKPSLPFTAVLYPVRGMVAILL